MPKSKLHEQCPTGTRYPTRTRSFFQYPIRTRFNFKIIGYFGYRVFHKTMFLTRKSTSRSYKILINIILYHLHLAKMDWLLWANFNGTLLHNYVTLVFPWVLHVLLHRIVARLSTTRSLGAPSGLTSSWSPSSFMPLGRSGSVTHARVT